MCLLQQAKRRLPSLFWCLGTAVIDKLHRKMLKLGAVKNSEKKPESFTDFLHCTSLGNVAQPASHIRRSGFSIVSKKILSMTLMAYLDINRLLGGAGHAEKVPGDWEDGFETWQKNGVDATRYARREYNVRGHEVTVWVDEALKAEDARAIIEWWTVCFDERAFAAQKELLKEGMSTAGQYTNVIMLAGYAALFAIWSQMKDRFTDNTMLAAAILMIVSLSFFVGWELYGMTIRLRNLLGMAKSVADLKSFPKRMLAHS
ncbi:hypothetical protein J7435_15850 [Xanthomonas phaseoli pv. dieffenbachiae]|uniref:hypothetical protein n=1 Tax=Xanthomonas phaseoli TaxID=1985254 RepID=UPI001ADA4777|nr:hypothetical protein [Xanthomonas phaseoli]MBO9903380.1 hypothetical protein [Xanthomonas phaseoli pv. dieffenbachiae]